MQSCGRGHLFLRLLLDSVARALLFAFLSSARQPERLAAMRVGVLLLCTLVADARATGFLSPGALDSAREPALLEALKAGGCGQPCARVLQSALDAIANKSAGTVHAFCGRCCCVALCMSRFFSVFLCRMSGGTSSSSSVLQSLALLPDPGCVTALGRARGVLLQVTSLPRSWKKVARPPSLSAGLAITVHCSSAVSLWVCASCLSPLVACRCKSCCRYCSW